jgi:hypothetical protein
MPYAPNRRGFEAVVLISDNLRALEEAKRGSEEQGGDI